MTKKDQVLVAQMVAEAVAKALAEHDAQAQVQVSARKSSTSQNAKKKTATFMKYNVETGKRDIAVACTPAQKAAWEKRSENFVSADDRKATREANLKKWEADRKKFQSRKIPKDLESFIKEHPTCTRNEAKEHGFVGTRDDLKALKASLRK